MIRQFDFTWTTIWLLLIGYGLFFISLPAQAQTGAKRISLELKDKALPDALKLIEKAGGKSILFTYNGTESYRVTMSIREKTEREAIDLVLSGKPFICMEREDYFVVQQHKSDKAIAVEGTNIYINGRKVRDNTELNCLQANEILSAEIITTPGVQYGSSVKVVIRLRTIRKRGQGMSGNFYTDYSQGRVANGYYNSTHGKWNIDFNADYVYGRDRIQQYAENNGIEDATSSNRVRNRLYAAKLLITAPLWKGKLCFGTEETFTNRHDIFLQNGFSADADDRIKQTMISGFADYNLPLGKFNISAGLRYEFQKTDYYEKGIHQKEQSPTYRHWIPVVGIAYTPGDWSFSLSYRTIKYSPSYEMLTSAITYQNKYAYRSGDPFLVPQIHRNISLDGGWKWVNFSLFYDHTWDMYTSYTKPYDDVNHPGVLLFSMASIPHTNQYGGAIVLSPQISIWQPQLTSGINWYDSHAAPINITQHWNEPVFYFSLDNSYFCHL